MIKPREVFGNLNDEALYLRAETERLVEVNKAAITAIAEKDKEIEWLKEVNQVANASISDIAKECNGYAEKCDQKDREIQQLKEECKEFLRSTYNVSQSKLL